MYHTRGSIEWGGGGGVTALKRGFLNTSGPNPLKNHKLARPEFNVGPSSSKYRFAGGR